MAVLRENLRLLKKKFLLQLLNVSFHTTLLGSLLKEYANIKFLEKR
jgi:hypothetical protein